MPKRQPPFVRVEFRCRKQQHLHNAGSPLPSPPPSSSCPHGFCSNMQHLGFDPPRPLWLALPIAGPNMVLRPHDINMQIWADNDAKPHNQQIINSPFPPWLPSAHASSTCGKRHSCVLHNFRPPPSLRSQRVIAASNGPNMLTRVRHNLMKDLWKQAGTLKKKSVYRTGYGETVQQNIEIISNGLNNHISIPAEMKGGEQVLPAHFQHPPSALIPWKNWCAGKLLSPVKAS